MQQVFRRVYRNEKQTARGGRCLAILGRLLDHIANEGLCGWPDVLVYPEEIRGIVLFLDFGETMIVFAIACLDAVLAFFHHKVYVGSARRERMEGVPKVFAPRGDFLGVRRVGVNAHNHLGEERLAETICRIFPGNALRRPVHWIEMHRRKHGRYLGSMFDEPSDRFIAQFGEVVSPPIPLETRTE